MPEASKSLLDQMIDKLEALDPEDETVIWARQMREDGVNEASILATLGTAGKVTPAKFRRVPREDK